LNRIDDTIVFHQLNKEDITKIIDIQVKELFKRMSTMNISIELTKAAKEFLAEKGYDQLYGARPLRRALQKYVEDPVAEEILKGTFTEGSVIKVKLNKKKDDLTFTSGSHPDDGGEAPEELKQEDAA
ncbi:MAG: ATP-dependent Clp protease ATP-binding subunit, partial [Bacteroidetes bacterium]|nr:ATP-dependent Clp protease ATP-binding subunit [Bacteroidota bacterium]